MFFRSKKEQLENVQEKCIKNILKLTDSIIDNTIRNLYLIQDIDDLKVSEADKAKNRKIFINKAVNELLSCSQNIKELSKTANHR